MVNRSITTDSPDPARLRRGFQRQVLLPNQPSYDTARRAGTRWWTGGRR
jgi:hypothetical protein